jgi:hypothetical protein
MDHPVGVFGTEDGWLDTDRPDVSATSEQRSQSTDCSEKVSRVLLHHRQEQVAARMSTKASMLDGRQSRKQDASSLALVSRQRQRTSQDITRRQHAELIAELARTPSAVEHRDNGMEGQPRVAFQAAQQARESGSTAEASDLELAQPHSRGF